MIPNLPWSFSAFLSCYPIDRGYAFSMQMPQVQIGRGVVE